MLLSLVIFCLVILALLTGAPVGTAMIAAALLGLWLETGNFTGTSLLITNSLYDFTSSYAFITIPMFILLGELAAKTGISADLFELFSRLFGRRRGGMALAVNFSCAGFSAVTGSTTSATMAMCKVALPEMRRFGYKDELSSGIVASAGTLAALIPPSVILVVFGILTNQSIGRLLLAGIMPGIILALLYGLRIYIRALLQPHVFPVGDLYTTREKLESAWKAIPFLLIVMAIVGGMLSGFWTPSEGGAVGVAMMVALGAWRRKLTLRDLYTVMYDTLISTASIFTVIIGSILLAKFLAFGGLTSAIVQGVTSMELSQLTFFICLVIMYLVMGMFIEGAGMMALTLPVVMPVVIAMGWDPIWFGIVFVVLCEIALVTPPVGLNLYVIRSVAPDIPIETVIKGVLFLIPADIVMLALLYYWPQIALWIPRMVMG
ncbi:MAG: C4-dicarboxylate ABC transporter permease [Alphaproteobacteria bacterium]|nr:MAG: C4-dicarboxylate ABC transporter permease [Alphaproteobacteria bacterium]